MTKSATHLNLINRVNEKTGSSVAMYAGVMTFPVEWGQVIKVSCVSGDRCLECTRRVLHNESPIH